MDFCFIFRKFLIDFFHDIFQVFLCKKPVLIQKKTKQDKDADFACLFLFFML